MKIAIIGYGKMGKEIEKVALERGHEIVVKFDDKPKSEKDIGDFTTAEVALEFSNPGSAINNYRMCFNMNIPVVSGTTGWLDRFDDVIKQCKDGNHSFFYSPNFSLGVNIMFDINQKLARLMNKYDNYENYDVNILEEHHISKIDKPSGTAIRLADDICEFNPPGNELQEQSGQNARDLIRIDSKRDENITGNHTVRYESDVDYIELSHVAKNRKGFAFGAVIAAEFIQKRKGFYTMKDLMAHLI